MYAASLPKRLFGLLACLSVGACGADPARLADTANIAPHDSGSPEHDADTAGDIDTEETATDNTSPEETSALDTDPTWDTSQPDDNGSPLDVGPEDTATVTDSALDGTVLGDTPLEDVATQVDTALEDVDTAVDTERDTALGDVAIHVDTDLHDTAPEDVAAHTDTALQDTAADTSLEDTSWTDSGAPVDDISDGLAPCATPCVTGRLRFERRRPNAAATALSGLELSPLAHHPVGLIGHPDFAMTDAEGRFVLELPPGATCALTVAAMVPSDPLAPFAGAAVAVVDADSPTLPSIGSGASPVDRVWAWSLPCTAGQDLDLTIRMSEGSGALAALETVRLVLEAFTDHFGPTPLELAIVWRPGRSWSCGSCYLDGRFDGVTLTTTNTHFPRAIYLSGNNANPHHFTPSIIAHELGHFALELWSSPPLIGGSHGFDRRVAPVLAWSEGAATLLGQWALIGHTGAPQRFFAVQQNVQYWVDLEAIGRGSPQDDSNVNLLVPLPRPQDPIDQMLSEGVVAAILWDLLDADDFGLGDESFALSTMTLSLLADPRLTGVRQGGPDRAAEGPDLVDYLDGLRCDESLVPSLPAVLTSLLLGFPYDEAPVCGLP